MIRIKAIFDKKYNEKIEKKKKERKRDRKSTNIYYDTLFAITYFI